MGARRAWGRGSDYGGGGQQLPVMLSKPVRIPVNGADARVMLLDTASLYFRAFYGLPLTLTAPDGTPVNAVRGLLDFTARLVRDYSPTHLVACWDDDWRPEFRVAAIPSYKAHRVAEPAADGLSEAVPEELAAQVPVIVDVLAALGIARVGVPGFEADDVIATLCTKAHSPVRIVTGDRDLFQLVDDARGVAVLYTASRGVARVELVDDAWLVAKYDIPSGTYGDYALLRGDPSDGLPGVKGVGERTASGLLRSFGDLAGIRAAAADPASDLRPAVRSKLLAASDYLDIAPSVVLTVRDLPIPDDLDARLPRQPVDPAALAALSARWGVETSVARLTDAMDRSTR